MRHLTEEDVKTLFVENYSKFVAFAGKFAPAGGAEDMIQDIFLQILKKRGDLSIAITLENYVYRAIKNRHFDSVKSESAHFRYTDGAVQLSIDEFNYYDPAKNSSLTLNENEQALYAALEELPPKCREIIKSKYLSRKKILQISAASGISPKTVETHVYKAVKQLKSAFKAASVLFTFL